MAIVQISRITNRKGLNEDLPQLAGAEFGWCIDSRRLFIGNGTLEEGAPVIGNTEILTQYSDITVLSNYTYQDIAVGYAAQTGPSSSQPVVRTVQAKLDDFADVRDFGAVGDGVADDTVAINRALYQLYCREINTQIRRSLYFPAGTYRVSSTIVIPTYAKLVGEGADCSIIYMAPDDSSVPDYVACYGDSLQQTGVNIGNNGATPPRNIEIGSMSFSSAVSNNAFLVDQANQCWFDSVNFTGIVTEAQLLNAGVTPLPEVSCLVFNSIGNLVTSDITFDKCGFYNMTYAVNSDVEVAGITVSNSQFNLLYQGISLTTEPTGFRVLHNVFDNIYAEGVVFSNTNLNISAYNVFFNVGNSIGAGSPTSPCLSFSNDSNASVSDVFQRNDADANIYPRINVTTGTTSSGGVQIQLGRYTRNAGKTFTLANNQSLEQLITTINAEYINAFAMKYTIQRADLVRHGVLTVATGPQNNSIPVSYYDDYTETGNVGIVLSVSQIGDDVSINYTSTSTGINGVLTQSISNLA